MAADVDIEALGLLDGLEGDVRQERAELIEWLLDHGFSVEHIRASVAAPLLLPAHRVMGDDGSFVSAREVCESTGLDPDLLQRLQRTAQRLRTRLPWTTHHKPKLTVRQRVTPLA